MDPTEGQIARLPGDQKTGTRPLQAQRGRPGVCRAPGSLQLSSQPAACTEGAGTWGVGGTVTPRQEEGDRQGLPARPPTCTGNPGAPAAPQGLSQFPVRVAQRCQFSQAGLPTRTNCISEKTRTHAPPKDEAYMTAKAVTNRPPSPGRPGVKAFARVTQSQRTRKQQRGK